MPTCPICGTEIEEGAGFCPKCWRRLTGQQTPKGKSKKKLAAIIVPCVIAVVVAVVLITHLLPVPSGHVAELEYVTVAAYDFGKKLFAPQLTSLQRQELWKAYQGKKVQWTSELKYVSTEREGATAYFVNPLDWARTEVVAVFDESQRSSLLELSAGDLVSYTGVLAGFGQADVRLTDCTVLSTALRPLWWNDDIDTHNKRILVGEGAVFLGPGTYDAATRITQYFLPGITAIDSETGELLWENEETKSILVGIDSRYVYAWHPMKIVSMSEWDYYWYWYSSNMMALDAVSGQIGWDSYLSEDTHCLSQVGCLPDKWSLSDFADCCILQKSVREEITSKGEPGLTFLMDKPPLSELIYEYQGVVYKSACAVYGGVGTRCGALQATDQETGDVLWMMTFQERGMADFSILDGILYVSTNEEVGAFGL
jgi:hypothetical protein